jgi:hypothetical protein
VNVTNVLVLLNELLIDVNYTIDSNNPSEPVVFLTQDLTLVTRLCSIPIAFGSEQNNCNNTCRTTISCKASEFWPREIQFNKELFIYVRTNSNHTQICGNNGFISFYAYAIRFDDLLNQFSVGFSKDGTSFVGVKTDRIFNYFKRDNKTGWDMQGIPITAMPSRYRNLALVNQGNTLAYVSGGHSGSGGTGFYDSMVVYDFNKTSQTWMNTTIFNTIAGCCSNPYAISENGNIIALHVKTTPQSISLYERNTTTLKWNTQPVANFTPITNTDMNPSFVFCEDTNTLFIGDAFADTSRGAIWIIQKQNGIWNTTGLKIQATTSQSNDGDGTFLAVDRQCNTLATSNGGFDSTTVYLRLYERLDSYWDTKQLFEIATKSTSDIYANGFADHGFSFTPDGNELIVPDDSYFVDYDNPNATSQFYFYHKFNNTWSNKNNTFVDPITKTDWRGVMIYSKSGDVLVAGIPLVDNNTGAILVYTKNSTSGLFDVNTRTKLQDASATNFEQGYISNFISDDGRIILVTVMLFGTGHSAWVYQSL